MAELNLRGQHLQPQEVDALLLAFEEPKHNIVLVDLTDTALDDEKGSRVLAGLTTNGLVRRLVLNDNDLSDDLAVALSQLLELNTVLEQLELQGNCIFSDGVNALADSLSKNRTLQHLDLGHNQLGIAGAELLAQGLPKANLTSLNLSGNRICGRGSAAVLTAGTGLQYLDLARNEIGPQGLEMMCEALETSNILSLSLAGNRLTCKDAAALAESICKCPSLEVLLLQQNDLGPIGTQHLSAVLPRSKLTALDLTGNSIGDEGIAAVAEVLQTSHLVALGLGHNSITDEGLARLCKCSWGPLKSLELQSNSLSDLGGERLRSALTEKEQKLQALDLMYNQLTPTLMGQLEALLA